MTPASSVQTDEFLDMILGDTDLLRSEFDAIIEAEWVSPDQAAVGSRGSDVQPPSDDPSSDGLSSDQPQRPADKPRPLNRWRRGRSPPLW